MTGNRISLNGGTYKLADLVDEGNNLVDFEATDVAFVGPAVVALIGSTGMEDCAFAFGQGGPESILWELEKGKTTIAGAIGITNGTFIRCSFRGIGFAGDSAALTGLLGAMTV